MKLAFIVLQLTNVVISSMLIMSGVYLFSFIRRAIHHVDKYLHTLVGLHIVASILILATYELRSLNEMTVTWQFFSQLSVFVLLIINGMMQVGIHRFIHVAGGQRRTVQEILDSVSLWSVCKGDVDAIGKCECAKKDDDGVKIVIFGRRSTDHVKLQ